MAEIFVQSRYPSLRGWAGVSSIIWIIRGIMALGIAFLAVYMLGKGVSAKEFVDQTAGWSSWILYIMVGRYGWVSLIVGYFLTVLWCMSISSRLMELGLGGYYYSPGGTFSAFFVPILSLYKAYCAIRDLYLTFSPELLYDSAMVRHKPVAPWWMAPWWLLVVISMLTSYILTRIMNNQGLSFPRNTDEFQYMLAATGIAIFIQSVCWVFMIWIIEVRQQNYLSHIYAARSRGRQVEELNQPYHTTTGSNDW